MFITEDFLACRSRHDGALRAVDQRFQQRLWSPCSVCRDHRKMVLQRRPRSLPSWHRLWLFAVQFTCHHLPFPVQVRLRMPRQHNSSSRPYLRRATHSPRGFCIVSPAVHLPAGKVLPVGTLETSGVVIHFILRALVVWCWPSCSKRPAQPGRLKV